MTDSKAQAVICGAGMAGIAAAYHLAVRRNVTDLILIDERAPLSLTSSKGTEAYRNCWPGPGNVMVRFMNRSIDLLEELARDCDNLFQLNRRGYAFFTSDPKEIRSLKQTAVELSIFGAGPFREHAGRDTYIPSPSEGFDEAPTGTDLITDRDLILKHYPFVAKDVAAMLHVRRCGWMDTQRLGRWMLARAESRGVRILQDSVESVEVVNNRVESVRLKSGRRIDAGAFVIAAGPLLKKIGAMLGLDLPVFCELHGKIAFKDHLGVTPRNVPLMIWKDPVRLPWTDEERKRFEQSEQTRRLLEEFPGGVHFRPRGSVDNPMLLAIWTYDAKIEDPVPEPQFDPFYAEVLLRGLSRMIPGISAYFGQGKDAFADGGYYCKTKENRPLIGPLPIEGAYVIGALSGFGIMASQAAAELLALHITGGDLPDYAPIFLLDRYENPAYKAMLATWGDFSGQL